MLTLFDFKLAHNFSVDHALVDGRSLCTTEKKPQSHNDRSRIPGLETASGFQPYLVFAAFGREHSYRAPAKPYEHQLACRANSKRLGNTGALRTLTVKLKLGR